MKQVTRAIVQRAVTAALSIVVLAGVGVLSAHAADTGNGDLDVLHVRKNVYMIAGDGQNIAVQVGIDGVVLVNAGTAAGTDRLLAAVKKISPLPIRYIIDTNADADAVGGNAKVAAAGISLFKPPISPGASIVSYDTVLARIAATKGQPGGFPDSAWPSDAYLFNRTTLYINGEPIEIYHEPAAHTDGDSTVLFRSDDVVFAGDVMDMTRFPMIDRARGGSVQGEIDALNHLLQLADPPTPLIFEYVGTAVIPGHGRLCDQWEVTDYRDMVVRMRDTVAYMMKQHMTLPQIEAANPAKAYPQYKSADMFIEAVYQDLSAKKAKKAKKVNASDEG
ncbi:MAG: MBL fold metallo-hydrolase [Steroidobacteraceae bacterium]